MITKSMIAADFEDEAAAKAFVQTDPYVTKGVFERVEIRPFRKVVP